VTRVWVHEYERECCGGEPFRVGDYVDWLVKPVTRNDWLERLFHGTRVAVDLSYGGDHGVDGEPPSSRVLGLVERIEEVHSRMLRTPIDAFADEIFIAEGTAIREPLTRADWYPKTRQAPDVEFVGYLVQLTP